MTQLHSLRAKKCPYSLRSASEINNNNAMSDDDVNDQFNSSTQFHLYIKGQQWSKQFKFEDKYASYVFFPDIYDNDNRVYLHFSTALNPSKKTTSWNLDMNYVINQNAESFEAIYDFVKRVMMIDNINNYYSNDYLNKITQVFNETNVMISKDLPIGSVCILLSATKEMKENNCDAVIIKKITTKNMNFQPLIQTTAVYLVENVQIDDTAVFYQQPPHNLRLRKWVNNIDVTPLASTDEMKENNGYFRNMGKYFSWKSKKLAKSLNNYQILDKKCSEQILSAIGVELERLLVEAFVGKTKRIGFVVPLFSGKYSIKRYLRDEHIILLKEWKPAGNIVTLPCDVLRHEIIFGAEATTKEYVTNLNGIEQKAFDICFETSSLKISEIDDCRSRVYIWGHIVKIMPSGAIVGKKGKVKRKKNNNNNTNTENDENDEMSDQQHNDPQLCLNLI